jgi:cysteinyl-tRNA synthetase
VDSDKKNPSDFVLWFFLTGRYTHHILQWPSPWGNGFPGWHLECSAISREALGQPFDIHTGGVDHIGTHHTNEIAQSEAAYGQPLAHFWLHNEHLLVDDRKMSKSTGNLFTLNNLVEKGFSPLDFRYLCLMSHYRSKMNFTWEALAGARSTLRNIRNQAEKAGEVRDETIITNVQAALNDDLDTPRALALLHQSHDPALWLVFEPILGLGLTTDGDLPELIFNLLDLRKQARELKDWSKSDELRVQIDEAGYEVLDTPAGQKVMRK